MLPPGFSKQRIHESDTVLDLCSALTLTSPGFFSVMYEVPGWASVMTMCLAAYAGALVPAGKILDIEVERQVERRTIKVRKRRQRGFMPRLAGSRSFVLWLAFL